MGRLIGPANEAMVYVDGKLKKALLDTGAQVSLITEDLCEELGLDILPLDQGKINLTGPAGTRIPYAGYVEVNLQIPDQDFNEDVLMLVIEPTGYHQKVSLCLGIGILRSAMRKFKPKQDEEVPEAWENIQYALRTANNAQNSVQEDPNSFTLNQVTGFVKSTKTIQVPPFATVQVSGVSTVRGHCGRVNVCTEGIPGAEDEGPDRLTVPTYGVLHLGSSRVGVGIRNLSSRTITIPAKTKIATIEAANKVPELFQKPRWTDEEEDENPTDETEVESTTVDQEEECEVGTYKWLKTKIDLSGMDSWIQKDQDFANRTFEEYVDIFSTGDLDLGKTKLTEHKIKLTDDKPFRERYRTIPPHMYEEVRSHLQEMLELGAITPSCSPWASAVVLVRKKDGVLRFCVDFRKLNERTVKDSYSIPRIEDTLNILRDAVWFSMLDQKLGYWQIPMKNEDKELTAFTVGPLGFYQCERMPFGLTNAPATFQRLMENCLSDINLNWCLIYLDDIVVFSTTPEEHITRLRAVFDRIRKAGLKLKPKKCFFFKTEVDYLGHVVSAKGVATNPKKIEAVRDWPIPITVTDVRKFLGFVGYYRRFIPKFSIIANPLHGLITGEEAQSSKQHKVKWTTDCQAAFQRLKESCINSPILIYAHYDEPFFLSTDASIDGLGAVLYQKREGNLKPIAYASRSLNNAEKKYTSHRLEFLALKWAITQKFHEYLYGAKDQVTVYTDNNPLTYILTTAKLDATGHRWVADLANYHFKILYRPGKENKDADALSRRPWYNDQEEVKKATEIGTPVMQATLQSVHSSMEGYIEQMIGHNHVRQEVMDEPTEEQVESVEDWTKLQAEDKLIAEVREQVKDASFRKRLVQEKDSAEMQMFIKQRSAFLLRDGILYRKTRVYKSSESRLQLVVPTGYRRRALEGTHDQVGHLGYDRMISLLRDRFYWPAMDHDAKYHVERCDRCRKFKTLPHKAPMENISATYPLELIHMDFLGIDDPKNQDKKKDVLVVTDHFTRYAQAYVTSSQTAVTTAKTLWEKFFVHYGFPEHILSDQGANFEGKVITELCKLADVKKIRTTPYHPQTNGQCERFNRTLLSMLGTLELQKKKNWPIHVSTLVHAYNCTRSTTTGYSPYYLLFGRHPRLPVDVAFGLKIGSPGPFSAQSEYVKQLNLRMQWAFRKASAQMAKESRRAKIRYDLRTKGVTLKIGDNVLVRKMKFTGKHKIQDKWEDEPYVVISQRDPSAPVYRIKNDASPKIRTLHRNMLLPLPPASIDNVSEENFEDKVSFSMGERGKGMRRIPLNTVKTGTQTLLDPTVPSFIPNNSLPDSMKVNLEIEELPRDTVTTVDRQSMKKEETEMDKEESIPKEGVETDKEESIPTEESIATSLSKKSGLSKEELVPTEDAAINEDKSSTQGERGTPNESEDEEELDDSSEGGDHFSLALEDKVLPQEQTEAGSSTANSVSDKAINGSPEDESEYSDTEGGSESPKVTERPTRVRRRPDRFGFTTLGGTNQMVEACSLAVRTMLSMAGVKKKVKTSNAKSQTIE